MLQAEDPSYHPLKSILRIATEESSDNRLKFDCHRTIARYVESERKSVEIKSADGAELVHMVIDIGEDSDVG
jgi:hypothetical protein